MRVVQLNVPLELSGLEHSPLDLSGDYRDQGLLHSVGDAWLDLRVVTSPSGAVCICHHYIYKVSFCSVCLIASFFSH